VHPSVTAPNELQGFRKRTSLLLTVDCRLLTLLDGKAGAAVEWLGSPFNEV